MLYSQLKMSHLSIFIDLQDSFVVSNVSVLSMAMSARLFTIVLYSSS